MGFIATPDARPKTLLVGDELDHTKAKSLKIVLSKARDNDKFSTVIVGTDNDLASVYDSIKDLINEDIYKRIAYDTTSKHSSTEELIAEKYEENVKDKAVLFMTDSKLERKNLTSSIQNMYQVTIRKV